MVPKKRGRPATGQGVQVGMRWSEPDLEKIDKWAKRQKPPLSRADAIRKLVGLGLQVKGIDRRAIYTGAIRRLQTITKK